MDNVEDRLSTLVRPDEGLVSRAIFSDQDVFDRELTHVFGRGWLFVGHEGLVPNPDDYFVSRMGKDEVILTRDAEGDVHVLLNTCTHRGMKLCRYDMGNNKAFTCPYHGWSFATDGRLVERPGALVGVPGFEEHYRGELNKSEWGLVAVPKVHNYKGTIWGSWDPEAPDFLDYLGDMRLYLDFALDGRDGTPAQSEVIGGVLKWRVPSNWKFAAENFIGDMYHDVSHRSVNAVGISTTGERGRRTPPPDKTTLGFPDLGHGVIGMMPHYQEPDYRDRSSDPEVDAYYEEVFARRAELLGNSKRVGMTVGTIFPNMSFHARQPRTIAVFHPISPTEMEMWRIFLVDKDAPQAVKDELRHYYMRYSGPAGMTESDDMENWSYATEASTGPVSQRMYFSYQMGLGHARPVPGLEGAVENGWYTEENARIYYNRWAQFMGAESWSDISSLNQKLVKESP